MPQNGMWNMQGRALNRMSDAERTRLGTDGIAHRPLEISNHLRLSVRLEGQ